MKAEECGSIDTFWSVLQGPERPLRSPALRGPVLTQPSDLITGPRFRLGVLMVLHQAASSPVPRAPRDGVLWAPRRQLSRPGRWQEGFLAPCSPETVFPGRPPGAEAWRPRPPPSQGHTWRGVCGENKH